MKTVKKVEVKTDPKKEMEKIRVIMEKFITNNLIATGQVAKITAIKDIYGLYELMVDGKKHIR